MARALYWLVCIPVRALIPLAVWACAAWTGARRHAVSLGLLAVGGAFAFLWAGRLRMRAPESSTGATWWHAFRVAHSVLFAAAGLLFAAGNRLAPAPLVADVLLGAALGLRNRA